MRIVAGKGTTATTVGNGGGAMFYGESKSLNLSFSIPVTGGVLSKDLPFGDWIFYAVMWDGSTPLTGVVKCARPASYTLKDATVDLTLTLTQANCQDSIFAKSSAFYTYAIPNFLYPLSVNLCAPTTNQSTLSANGYCPGSYAGMATGMKARLLQKDLSGSLVDTELVSTCTPVNSGMSNLGLQLPSGNISDYLGAVSFEVYYSSSYPSCTGDDCCAGKVDKYIFPKGFNNPTNNSDEASLTGNNSNTLYLKEHSPVQKVVFTGGAVMGMAEYKSCNYGTLELHDPNDNVIVSSEAMTITPTCNGKCTFYSDDSCTTAVNSYTISSGMSAQNFYFKPNGPALTLTHTGGAKYAGDSKTIGVHTTWANIDSNYVWSETNLYGLPNTTSAMPGNMNPGGVWIYQTRNGNRGVMKFNSVSTSSVTNDTFNFDFITWSSGGGIIATNTNVNVTACFSGTCYLELDETFGVTNDTATYQVEAWWENLSGSLYFNPQASMPFISLPL